ncbi:thermonuclease family protein [Porticoccus sp. W117]|uniref:thermonuclease family protein n=1 Tax=Porticoccus sp. W117 TaxID=3054777 RepID=UPI002599EDA2|nr:thermonuclease family protein [Porticoccus sp. W117]MDM3872525.1 thermonuclease family protein [Porticoccus sp. W117]
MFSLSKSAAGFAFGAFFILAGFILTGCSKASSQDCQPFARTTDVVIAKVVDGDTVRLQDGRKVRLIGINAPELGRDGKPGQPFSRAAQKTLQQFLGKQARLLLDNDKKDKHGRVLAHLYNLNGDSAEAHLLNSGLAWHVAIPPNLSLAQCLADAEQRARQQRLGLWSSTGIKPVEAKQVSQGGFQIVSGKVTDVRFTKGGWWINIGPQIAAVIYSENQHRFDRKQLAALKGKTVSVRGWIYSSRSKKYQPWRVKLETPYGLETR